MKRFLRSHIGRRLDPSHASNRYVLVAAVTAGVIAGGIRLLFGDGNVLGWGFFGGAAAFMAWVIGRELDPDDNLAAGLAAPLALVALLAGRPGLGAGAAVIIALRIVVRSTGRSPTTFDLLVLTGAAGYFGTRPEAWVPLAGLVFAVAYDGIVTRSGIRRTVGSAAAMTMAGVAGALVVRPEWSWTAPDAAAWIIVVVGTVAAVGGLVVRPPASVGDLTGEVLEHHRLEATRWAGLAIGIGSFAILGGPGVVVLGPLWAAHLGVLIASRRARRSPAGVDRVAGVDARTAGA